MTLALERFDNLFGGIIARDPCSVSSSTVVVCRDCRADSLTLAYSRGYSDLVTLQDPNAEVLIKACARTK